LKSALDDAARKFPALRRDADGPVFRAPWEAQAFAMTLALHERGEFTWSEWAKALSEVIAEAGLREGAEGESYYQHWMTALERIVTRKGLVSELRLRQRRVEWEDAARRTPHGEPIHL
jgi:nitrile hydratase accessory protein